jgi:two-component system, OmpR family, alkaline phosphatase synthesis response regulator PhoP
LHKALIIAKDTVEIRELNSELTRMGFACSVTNNGSNFSNKLTKQAYDVLFVDIDGSSASDQPESMLEQLHELRITINLPAIALISGKELSRLDSNLGIDDFVVKPWNISEIVTRAKRVIKQIKIQGSDLLKHGDLVMDTAKCEVSISGRLITLTFKEYELLKFLTRHKGRVFTRDTLLNEVWGYDYYGGDRTVDVHIRRLRSKIEDADHTFIETVRNIGYKFSS